MFLRGLYWALRSSTSLSTEITHPVRKALFADDLARFLLCTSLTTGQHVLQECLNSLYKWSRLNGFTSTLDESAAVHFCRLYFCMREINLHINSVPVPTVSTATYFGLILNLKLTWRSVTLPPTTPETILYSEAKSYQETSTFIFWSWDYHVLNICKAIMQSELDCGAMLI